MFTKIKAALASFAIWIAQRIKPMDLEAELAAGVAATEDALKAAAAEAAKVVDKIEGLIEPAKVAVQIPVINAVPGSPTPISSAPVVSAPVAPAVISATDTILSQVKDLLSIAERDVSSFDAFAALAKKSVTGNADAVLAKLKAVMAYAKVDAVDVFDEVVAAAKALK